MDRKSKKLRFVGYSKEFKGYRLLDENTSRVFIRRDVVFKETDFGHKAEEVVKPRDTVEVDTTPDEANRPEAESQQPDQQRRSERQRRPPVKYGLDEYADTATVGDHIRHVAYNVCQLSEPQKSPDLGTALRDASQQIGVLQSELEEVKRWNEALQARLNQSGRMCDIGIGMEKDSESRIPSTVGPQAT